MCKARIEAERIAHQVKTNTSPAAPDGTPADSSAPKGKDGKITAAELRDAGAQVVKDSVTLQMSSATSPEMPVKYPLPDRSRRSTDLDNTIQTFELRSGPSDVIGYHDFHSLQIAFEDVWTELWDDDLKSFGQQLYTTYVETGQHLQMDIVDPAAYISALSTT